MSVQYLLKQGDRKTSPFGGCVNQEGHRSVELRYSKFKCKILDISIMPLSGSPRSSFPGGELLKPTCFAAKCRRIDAGSPEKSHSLKNNNKREAVFVHKSIFILKSIFSTTTWAESLFLI